VKELIYKLKNIPVEKIKLQIACGLLLLDLFNIFYINRILLNDQNLMKHVRLTMTMGQFNPDLPSEYLQEIDSLLFQSIWIMLVLFVMNNLIFYYLYLKSRKSGIQYIKVLAYSGALLSLVNLFSPGTNSILWIIGLVLQLALYILISWVIRSRTDIIAIEKSAKEKNPAPQN